MKRQIIYIISILFIGMQSCDFLDKEFDASLSEAKVFNNESLTRQFLTNIYVSLPDGMAPFADNQFTGASRDCMTDNAYSYWGLHYYAKINTDSYTAADHPLLGFWNSNTSGIRKVNVFLKNAKESVVGNSTMKGDDNKLYDRYRAEAKLLRAIFHFDLVGWFGDAPIVGEDENGEPIIFDMANQGAMNVHRDAAADVLEWVAEQCDEVKDILPFRYENEDINWGRVNGATAYALKARALLYRASKLNNPTNDKSHWRRAADAAVDFVELNKAQKRPYKLYSNYAACFYDDPTHNDEIILSRSVWVTNTVDLQLLPPGFTGSVSGAGRTNPTQNFVDAFEMNNGKRIDESGSGYDKNNPYSNRDPRLSATIFHHGSVWGRADYGEERMVDVHYNSATDKGADYRESMGGTYTGYYQKKFVNPNLIMKEPKSFPHSWVIFRYAEVLLNAAEAINEAEGPEKAYEYVNEVRERSGMPPYSGMTQDEFRKRIRNERRVELCFEDHRFFDSRRWKLFEGVTADNERSKPRYDQVLNMYGMQVRVAGVNVRYTVTGHPGTDGNSMSLYVFNDPKNYYFPLPRNEVKKAPNLGQNPGW